MCTACCSLPDHSCLIYFGLFYSCFQPHGGSDGRKSTCSAGDQVPSLGREDLLEKGMATHSSILAWRIPWTEEPGGLQSTGLQRVGHRMTNNILLFNRVASLVPDILPWLKADQSWVFIFKHCRKSFKDLSEAFLFYITFFKITGGTYFLKSSMGRLESFLLLCVEHNGLCRGWVFCSL